jgi:glucoamylase
MEQRVNAGGMAMTDENAPGRPGIPPRWTSSAKSGVGTALNGESRVWFTLSHGILNEVYFPRVDKACIRDLGFIVTDGNSFFSEERRHTSSAVSTLAPGVPAYQFVNTCVQGRYRIEKAVVSDPHRHVVLQRIRFSALQGSMADYHLYALLAPHLANCGSDNTAWVGDYKGVPMLMAEHDGNGLALACSAPWLGRSAGFVGYSDGWQDLVRNKRLTWFYPRAEKGNVALVGEIDLHGGSGELVLALGFGGNSSEAAQHALASILDGFDAAADDYVKGWQNWQQSLIPLSTGQQSPDLYRVSASVLRAHESKAFPGGIIASLSIPWGNAKGDEDLGGYHLVWPRDLVETAGGLLAAGACGEAMCVLRYLQVTQEDDGHWSQNMWLDGTPYWNGIQMDETAFPILLVDLLRRNGALDASAVARFWPMVRRAAAYIVRNGPVTQQDRWEEDPGYSPFTLAAEIAALLVAADLADVYGEPATATYLRESADTWNDNIEKWVYVAGTELGQRNGVEGYYVRIAPPEEADAASPHEGFVPIKNRPLGENTEPAEHIISPDFLALVRFGLRAPNDPRILNTLKIVDALLKVEMPQGPLWHRYNDDGYGEHEDGSAFDGTGIGRAWPLLTGERAHYELAAGRKDEAERLRRTLECSADPGGMISEQTWDAPDMPDRELFFGRPSGSARPLVWAHAEYVKLVRSLRDGRIFDQPPQPAERYITQKQVSPYTVWRENNKTRILEAGKKLRVELRAPAVVHWTATDWQTAEDTPTSDTGLGVYTVDLPTQSLLPGRIVEFTFFFPDNDVWQGTNFSVLVR